MFSLRRDRIGRLAEARQGGRREVGGPARGETEEGQDDSKGKKMRRKITFGKKKAMGSSFNGRPPAPRSGNDEEEKEEEEEEEGEEEKEEKEEEERKGWSD